MATRTLGLVQKNQPEAVHAGVNAAVCRLSFSVSVSGGDTWVVGKLPHAAIPLDAIFIPNLGVTGIGTFVAKFGTSLTQSLFFDSLTYSVTTRATLRSLGTQNQISLSDDMMPRLENVVMVATAGASLGYIGDLVIFYRMPGPPF